MKKLNKFNYTIENLVKEFEKHHVEFLYSNKDKDDFSLPQALMIICQEIKKLKDKSQA